MLDLDMEKRLHHQWSNFSKLPVWIVVALILQGILLALLLIFSYADLDLSDRQLRNTYGREERVWPLVSWLVRLRGNEHRMSEERHQLRDLSAPAAAPHNGPT
jgi:hypothetical protein